MNKLIIIGAGGHGRVAADIAELMGYDDISFLDDRSNCDVNVIGTTNDITKYAATSDFFVAIGNPDIRKKFFDELKINGARIVRLIHPSAIVARSAILGDGILIAAGAVVGVNAIVEDGAIVNTLSSVDHDCVLKTFSHISGGAHMVGGTHIDSFSFVGVGATIVGDVCAGCFIGAGAVVAKSITESGTYVGVPARKIK